MITQEVLVYFWCICDLANMGISSSTHYCFYIWVILDCLAINHLSRRDPMCQRSSDSLIFCGGKYTNGPSIGSCSPLLHDQLAHHLFFCVLSDAFCITSWTSFVLGNMFQFIFIYHAFWVTSNLILRSWSSLIWSHMDLHIKRILELKGRICSKVAWSH